jgi:prepilin-type N-terminal cleavage/methylation domain-containing protein
MKNNKGFSFVELLVAVAILGIISLPIASSFALAAKTDAKAVHLSAMNDAADDVMLLIGEIEDGYIVSDSAFEINPETRDRRLNELILSFHISHILFYKRYKLFV